MLRINLLDFFLWTGRATEKFELACARSFEFLWNSFHAMLLDLPETAMSQLHYPDTCFELTPRSAHDKVL